MDKKFIITGIKANYNQDINIAKECIRAIIDSSEDSVKRQNYIADTIPNNCDNELFSISTD